MEHLKLFATRLNIPRLIRVCEDYHHWKELVYLYIQYDEYDNAALVMIAHSPIAWEHVLFKDVAVKARRPARPAPPGRRTRWATRVSHPRRAAPGPHVAAPGAPARHP